MVQLDFWHVVEGAYVFLTVFVSLPALEIAKRAGISRRWQILLFVPGVNVFSYFLVAYLPWPALRTPRATETSSAANPPYNPNLLPPQPAPFEPTARKSAPPPGSRMPRATDTRISYIIGPDGSPMTVFDLPSAKTQRWSLKLKADVIAAIRGGLISREEIIARYRVSEEKLRTWKEEVEEADLLKFATRPSVGDDARE